MRAPNEIKIPQHALKALETLEAAGFEAWCVGGCVRDSLLGRTPFDWDITTAALPTEILRCFKEQRTIETGIKHGTVTVIIDDSPLEITTFRSDGDYTDHRHPGSVEFSRRLGDDLSRRDFTVNALAYHHKRGLIDEFGGIDDLNAGMLRCVGEPKRRFTEDALRIMRCLRFAGVLGFKIEKETANAAVECRGLLESISHERIHEELTKLLCSNDAAKILREYSEIIFTVLPELAPMKGCTQETPYHCFDVWEHTLHAVDFVPRETAVRWAALLHDCGKPDTKFFDENGVAHFHGHDKRSAEIAVQLLKRLRFSNKEAEEITTLIAHHGERAPLPEKRIKRLLGKLGEDTLFKLFELMRGDLSAKTPGLFEERHGAIDGCEAEAKRIIAQGECFSLKSLAVNGADLISVGFEKGPELGKALNTLLSEVVDGAVANKSEALLHRAKALLKNNQ